MITDNIIELLNTNTDVATTNNTQCTPEINLNSAIGGSITVKFAFNGSTLPTANKTLDLYLLASTTSGSNYDRFSLGRNILLGSVKVEAIQTVDQQITVTLDPSTLCVSYGKLVVLNSSDQTVTLKNIKMMVRKAN